MTPVIGFIPEFNFERIRHNEREIESVFAVPLSVLLDPAQQEADVHATKRYGVKLVRFTGGPHVIWGLTGEWRRESERHRGERD